jgi:hypothetical protein
MRFGQIILVATLIVIAWSPARAESVCLSKYRSIETLFEQYNAKSAVVNGIMDRINTYANAEVDIRTIRDGDAKAWRLALEDAVPVGQTMLQTMMEYRAQGCSPDQSTQLNDSIEKLTADLRIARARINALANGLPASVFR